MNVLTFPLQIAGPITPNFTPPYPTQQCQLNSQGITIVVQVLDSTGAMVNIRLATNLKIILVRPSGVIVEQAASLYTSGFDGQMSIISSSTVPAGTGLDEVGTWLVQGKLTLSSNIQFTAQGSFSVLNNLGA